MAGNLGNQYAPPKSAVADVADEDTQLASRVARLVAVTLDGLLGFIAFIPASWLVGDLRVPPTAAMRTPHRLARHWHCCGPDMSSWWPICVKW